ncbi:MAG TPA: ornithine cyclodeaminase family protein [Actinomycetota bacterium]|nr:ornithine cyclodeaminase family protein [Actinomycetota bacterium]
MTLPYLDRSELRGLLPMRAAIDALERAFSAPPSAPPRANHSLDNGQLLVMPAWSEVGVGVKLVTVAPENPDRGLPLIQGLYLLFDPDDLRPRGLIDGAALTELRTGAVSGLATRHLANRGPSHVVVFGSGTQAGSHVEAMATVLDVRRVTIVAHREDDAFLERCRALGVEAGWGSPDDVASADVVCTCTTSGTPLFDGDALRPGTHVNAIGTHSPERRELDGRTMERGTVVVETLEAALAEAGEVFLALEEGVLQREELVTLSAVVGGEGGRRSPEDITIFKSVGVGFEDLAAATAAFERLGSEGTGAGRARS